MMPQQAEDLSSGATFGIVKKKTFYILKKQLLLFIFSTSLITYAYSQSERPFIVDSNKLKNTHDIDLPKWGPYSKRYAGFSHVPELSSGLRFDFSVMPGYYRNKILIPNVRFE